MGLKISTIIPLSSPFFKIYANSLQGDFLHDDIPAIVRNPNVNLSRALNGTTHSVFTDDFWGTPMSSPVSHKSYRPITTLLFRLAFLFASFYALSFVDSPLIPILQKTAP